MLIDFSFMLRFDASFVLSAKFAVTIIVYSIIRDLEGLPWPGDGMTGGPGSRMMALYPELMIETGTS